MNISIIVDDDLIHLRRIEPYDIEASLAQIHDIIQAMCDKAHRQKVYEKRYGKPPFVALHDFNGDMLEIAIGIRGLDDIDIADAIGVSEDDIEDMLNGLVKPFRYHVEALSKLLQFPIDFFLQEYQIVKTRFMCKMPAWAG